jgi:uncharacterized protein
VKLHSDSPLGINTITGYGKDYIEVNRVPYRHAVLVGPSGEIGKWGASSFATLDPSHFAQIADLKPELVIFGSGAFQRFPRPDLLRALINAKIGFEIMDTQAACRTYNILVGEGRQAMAALLLDPQ